MNISLAYRLSCLVIFSLLSCSSWSKDVPKPTWFAVASESGDANAAPSFSLDINEWKCRVNGKGRGQCSTKGRTWSFKLPVADGSISNMYVEANGRGNLVYSVDNGETVWGVAALIAPRRTTPKWVVQLPGLNFTTPLIYGDRLIVASAMSVASISATTGEWIWRHQWVHDGGAAFSPIISVDLDVLKFAVVAVNSKAVGEPICFKLDFGSVVTCK